MSLFTKTKRCNVTGINATLDNFYRDNSKAVNNDGHQNRLAAITRFSVKNNVSQKALKELFNELHSIAG